jgi:heat shock protein HtpX
VSRRAPDRGLFDHVAANRRASALLVAGVTALLLACGALFSWFAGASPWAGLAVAAVVAAALTLVARFFGSSIVLASSGAREIGKADDPELVNVVEEMAIAAGLPPPRVYVLPDAGMNAFATGMSPREGVVAVTRGLRERLTRDELQGVVAHELAHIGNADSRLMVLLAVLVGSVAILCDVFLRSIRFSGGRRRGGKGGGGAVMLVLALVFALVAPFVAQILRFAVSRKREFLADATAATLTRNPGALADALEKLSGQGRSLDAANRGTQHLFIVNPFRARSRAGVFSTHPPAEERIRRLRNLAGRAYPLER